MKKVNGIIVALCCAVSGMVLETNVAQAAETTNPTYIIAENYYSNSKHRTVYDYDANGKLQKEVETVWDDAWQNYAKQEYSYGTDGKLKTVLGYNWDSYAKSWNEDVKKDYSYNSAGRRNQVLLYVYSGGGWMKMSTTTWTYDIAGKETVMMEYVWNSESSKWDESSKYEYSYDASGKLKTEEWSVCLSGSWRKESQTEYKYDGDGKLMTQLVSYLESGVWEVAIKYEYAYKEDGMLLSISEYKLKGSWTLTEKTTYYYDNPEGIMCVMNGTKIVAGKVVRDGKVLIERDGKVYDLTGKEVKQP